MRLTKVVGQLLCQRVKAVLIEHFFHPADPNFLHVSLFVVTFRKLHKLVCTSKSFGYSLIRSLYERLSFSGG
jgi:hypothetical protein